MEQTKLNEMLADLEELRLHLEHFATVSQLLAFDEAVATLSLKYD